jgi:hypothetical protein
VTPLAHLTSSFSIPVASTLTSSHVLAPNPVGRSAPTIVAQPRTQHDAIGQRVHDEAQPRSNVTRCWYLLVNARKPLRIVFLASHFVTHPRMSFRHEISYAGVPRNSSDNKSYDDPIAPRDTGAHKWTTTAQTGPIASSQNGTDDTITALEPVPFYQTSLWRSVTICSTCASTNNTCAVRTTKLINISLRRGSSDMERLSPLLQRLCWRDRWLLPISKLCGSACVTRPTASLPLMPSSQSRMTC